MTYERKIINDPVFGFINIPKGLLYDIIRHPLLQRLTRIKQVGLSSVVYPGAQHTRFQHSLGAFYLMSEAITQLASKGNFIFDSEAEAVQAAILLHDIGHGPFSHVLEDTIVKGITHEEISLMLMERMNKEMNRLKVVLAETKRTNRWLAEQLGKDQATVSKWCTNTSQPSLETLFQIAECLGVDIKDLLWSIKNDK